MRRRSWLVLQALSAVVCMACGRIGVFEYTPGGDQSSDASVGSEDASAPAPEDAADLGDVAALDADANALDAASVEDADLDASPAVPDAAPIAPADATLEAALPEAASADCHLTSGGTAVAYRVGEVGRLEGTHTLQLAETGLCAAPTGCGSDLGATITQSGCSISPCQMWDSFDMGGGWFALRNGSNGACLYMEGANDGTSPVSWECFTSDTMRWQVVCAGSDTWYLQNALSSKRIGPDPSTAGGAGIAQSAQADPLQQRWRIVSNPTAFNVVMSNAQTDTNPVWRYTTTAPTASWSQPAFNDASWATGAGAFGDTDRGFTTRRTSWTSNDIWLRRNFALSSLPPSLSVKVFHDESVEVFINGMMVAMIGTWTNGYRNVDVPASVLSALVVGTNTVAVHCHNATPPQFVDLGLVTYTWR